MLADNLDKYPLSWSPDGRSLLYGVATRETGADLWVLPVSGERKPFSFVHTQFTERAGRFSPDGRWIAYDSNESGRFEVYVAPFPGPGGKWQVSAAGGIQPRWRGDGKEIFYIAPDNKLMAATVDGRGSAFEPGSVKPLLDTRANIIGDRYDVSADGQRFLVNMPAQGVGAEPITLVVNWTAGLKQK